MQVATAWENGTVKLRSIDWLTGDSGRVLAQGGGGPEMEAMISAVCRQRLAGNSLLTTADTDAAPILRGREGEDVCAWQPAWYDRVFDAVLGWMR
jgi:hypothetical protein